MKKKLLPLMITILLLSSAISYAKDFEQNIRVYDINLKDNSKGKYKVIIPRIVGFEDLDFERKLNNKLEENEQKRLREFSKRAEDDESRIDVNYELKLDDDIISIAVYKSEILNGKEVKHLNEYINIDVEEEKKLELKDIFKVENYKNILGKKLDREITGKEDFYLEKNGDLVIVFNNFEKANKKVEEMKIRQKDIKAYLKDKALVGLVFLKHEIKTDIDGDVSVLIPRIKGLNSFDLQNKVNDKIKYDVKNRIDKFKRDIEKSDKEDIEFKVNYNIRNVEDIISVELTVYKFIDSADNMETEKIYYNIDNENNNMFELKDLFRDSNFDSYINEEITDRINKNISDYFDGEQKFKSINKYQKFYIDNFGNVVISFDQGQISPKNKGIKEFTISSYNISDKFKSEYRDLGVRDLKKFIVNDQINYFREYMYISENGNLIFPIEQLAEETGYDIDFNSTTEILTLKKGGKYYTISLKANQYKSNDALVILEDEAKSVNGLFYVPQLYVDRVLGGKTYVKDGIFNIDLK